MSQNTKVGNYNPQEVISEGRVARWATQTKKYGNARSFLLGVAGVSFFLSYYNKQIQANGAQERIEYKKERLSQPVTDLSTSSGTTIPWSQRNAEEWLYKPVRITGRPLHNRAVLIPDSSYGLKGFQYIVPLCTKETENGEPIEGVFLNKGFIPKEREHVANRYRIENSFTQQTFTAYLSKMEDYQDHSPLQPGNTPDTLVRNKWNFVDLQDMAKVSGFENQAVVSAGVLQSVNLDTPLNERNTHHIDVSSDYKENYPYRQTLSGALQSDKKMPWNYANNGNQYFNVGIASGIAALLLSF